ncbi:MAG: hypothetical protein Q4C03_04725 [bacterium]|nr:hypothetical protein [bacterium]MDO5462198.1 hypothetical protein [bacterium]
MQKDNNALENFDTTLINLLHEVDLLLEEKYGNRFKRHPARPAQGTTANPQYDGLFTMNANFSAGIGSTFGPGYTLSFRLSTFDPIPEDIKKDCETIMVNHLQKRLAEVFPQRKLNLDKDQHGWKIHGDLSLN